MIELGKRDIVAKDGSPWAISNETGRTAVFIWLIWFKDDYGMLKLKFTTSEAMCRLPEDYYD
ncbi:hypothetical protein MCOR25_009909 [Pyricularia grisea]|nr:hypothetical protein MCOR25_009909 [Pyricularia grisea]